jgi:hypothetical protein
MAKCLETIEKVEAINGLEQTFTPHELALRIILLQDELDQERATLAFERKQRLCYQTEKDGYEKSYRELNRKYNEILILVDKTPGIPKALGVKIWPTLVPAPEVDSNG